MDSSFRKAERLCSHSAIERLYGEGHRLMAFPYSVQWLESDGAVPEGIPCQVLIVAPKRKFKHAVDRNRVKRLTRECFRQRKERLYEVLRTEGLTLHLSLVYIHNEILTYRQLEQKMDKLIDALLQSIAQVHKEAE